MNNKKNPFAAIGQAARSARETQSETELSPEPLPQVQPESSPESQPQVQLEPPIDETVPQKTNSRRRQAGKRSDPNYRQTTIYINLELDKKMKAAFLEDDIADFSEWVEKRIEEWLEERSKR